MKTFGIAGTKDKRGITVQNVTGYKLTAGRLKEINSRLFGIKLGNYKYE